MSTLTDWLPFGGPAPDEAPAPLFDELVSTLDRDGADLVQHAIRTGSEGEHTSSAPAPTEPGPGQPDDVPLPDPEPTPEPEPEPEPVPEPDSEPAGESLSD